MKNTIYIDMDDVICNYTKSYNEQIKINPAIQIPQAVYDFFFNLEPLPLAIESVNTLIDEPLFEIYILTAPSIRNPLCYIEKRLWIEKYFGLDFCNNLIVCSNKGLLKGQYLIDDNFTGKNQENFEGEFIHFGSKETPDWPTVLTRFEL